jgi:rhodanese-related sulfurtransferase
MIRLKLFVGLVAVVVISIGLASTSGCSTSISQESPANQPTSNPITGNGSSPDNYSPDNTKGNDNSTKTQITELTAAELAGMQKSGEKLVIIDVNPPAQYKEGHIQVAIHGDLNSLRRAPETYLNQLGIKKTDTIVLVCETGNRSAITLPSLVNAGYSTVYNLRDGNLGWLRAGFTLTQE